MADRCDALILGGGPAGATIRALLLARAGWSVTVLERHAFPRRKVCGEYLSGTNRPLLQSLGLLDAFDDTAGPEVTRVGLFAGKREVTAELPRPRHGWGRALSREHLDAVLLNSPLRMEPTSFSRPRSVRFGVKPMSGYASPKRAKNFVRRSSWLLTAHGMAVNCRRNLRGARRASDLFGFKAHFRNVNLPAQLMPLLAFPGGYGGMVHANDGLVSISCCIRSDSAGNPPRGSRPNCGRHRRGIPERIVCRCRSRVG